MKDYYFEGSTFIIENYLNKPTFSNFLPGLAGKKGIPLWAFYVNRGQGISGYGLQDKNHPIMEFTPANKAYESVGQIGFRTFIKVNGQYYEPFLPGSNNEHKMKITRASFSIEEENKSLGIKIAITYYGLPNENIAGLVRIVKVTNISNKDINIEMLDGINEILPAGIRNAEFKEISNLLSSWIDVDDLNKNIAFYKLRSSTGDHSEVEKIRNGNFMFGFVDCELVRPIVDKEIVFGFDSLARDASNFKNNSIDSLIEEHQVTVNKIPCGFIPVKRKLTPQQSIRINNLSGHTHSNEFLHQFIIKAKSEKYIDDKLEEAIEIIELLVKDVDTSTSSNEFNEYIKQNYLDNLLRGGYPTKIGNTIYHLYSRRHGDLERDYNFFSLAPEFYSQGGGNFRDVCQNRRMDSFINPEVEMFNINHFASLIQLDGFNPLTVNGMKYEIASDSLKMELIARHFIDNKELLFTFLSSSFSVGGLVNFIENNQIKTVSSEENYLNDIISNSKELIQSAFGEGYWIDHFTYILDLLESYEAIFPDKMSILLYNDKSLKSFDSPISVIGKNDKSVINKEGKIRQYGSLLHLDDEKVHRLKMNPRESNWAKIGTKEYHTNLFTKMLILVLNKHSQLDPDGIGVEMESNKPGWNDAMNGLPGLFGSGIGEAVELKRIVRFLLKYLGEESIELPLEINKLFVSLMKAKSYQDRLDARESYRESIRFGLTEENKFVKNDDLFKYLKKLDKHIESHLLNTFNENDKILPTFITYQVIDYEETLDEDQIPIKGNYGMPLVKPLKYQRRYLPRFLEAPARLLKTNFDKEELLKMHHAVKKSGIYDKELKLYKTSECLENETNEIGRIRAFTKGWLERESDFLHMAYKYLLGLLRAGLYEEFYKELNDNLVCFMDPAVYGRNPLENSSFIATSNNPNKKIHGQGFFARLSGSTIETINMWAIMMTGGQPFKLLNGELILKFEPKLPKSLFKEDKTLSFTFLKDIKVTYINTDLIDTYLEHDITKIELVNDDEIVQVEGDYITSEHALSVRKSVYKEIRVHIKKRRKQK